MNSQRGQIVLILVLVMTVGLAIGISVIQRSLSDVSTATKVEQSSRAFSAAEAGIEKALKGDSGDNFGFTFTENNSSVTVTGNTLIPVVPLAGSRQDPLEYPPLAKEETAHVWLADFNSLNKPPDPFYKQTSLDIYWGNSPTDKAALELTLVYFDSSQNTYKNRKWYLDNDLAQRDSPNHFEQVPCAGFPLGSNTYQCKYTVGGGSDPQGLLPGNLMLIRARLLYNTTSQPFAVQSTVTCPVGAPSCNDYSIPPQARIIDSKGVSGQTRRTIRLFQIEKVVPPYFDYAIFSSGEINK